MDAHSQFLAGIPRPEARNLANPSLGHIDHRPNWVREPSLEVCAEECGARCCRFGFFPVRTKEMRALKKLHPKLKVLNHENDVWIVDFELNGGQCPFLGDDYACTIYNQRPTACRNFPVKPYDDCLVWPTQKEEAETSSS